MSNQPQYITFDDYLYQLEEIHNSIQTARHLLTDCLHNSEINNAHFVAESAFLTKLEHIMQKGA